MSSGPAEPGATPGRRMPPHSNTPGRGSGVFDLEPILRSGGDQPAVRLVPQRDPAWAGALLVAVDAQR
ncbi:hypothetical protein PO587_03755 [Streptomyces gilvifuscus]|uniref:Uncharacterized protein n=1 Tax=Streptomyces gilvifuscus TaxID=1550617 RepID=A0ABT5FM35_9ACTN|nr:hypothetical protein [Streptomyces gilvifuscus]MDC2953565.1 hypothetical protein [Streptomyces gilvifuscus]